jgi:cation:H+ antiporter
VSIGTSLPELAIGITAAGEGSGELAVGNIAGTNIVNILFILGLSALLRPLAIEARTLRFELPVMTGGAVLLWALAVDGVLSRRDGVVLVCGAIVYTVALIRASRQESREVVTEYAQAYANAPSAEPDRAPKRRGRTVFDTVMMLGGIVVIVVGAEWLVTGAVGMAREFGVSGALIGLNVVAIGTSAPELVTTVVSTVRGQRDVAIGNLLGSSITTFC